MSRPLRIEFEDAWYHVMNRGAGYRDIYQSIKSRMIFIDLLSEVRELFGVEIHGYCLMSNHYHLLIKTPRGNLSRAMRHVNGVYTQRFNRLTKTDGPLFRGRYKAIVVEENSYLLQVSRYIHLNPVAAKLVKKPEQYKWSSYTSYLQIIEKPSWLKTTAILSVIAQKDNVNIYQRFVEAGLDDDTQRFYEKIDKAIIFGTKKFKEKLLSTLCKEKIVASASDYKQACELPTIDTINNVISKYFDVDAGALYQCHRGQKNKPRKIAIYGCRKWTEEKLLTIATRYNCRSHSLVSNIVKEIEEHLKVDETLAKAINEIRMQLGIKTNAM